MDAHVPGRACSISAGAHGVFRMKAAVQLGALALKAGRWVGIPALLQTPVGHENITRAFCVSVPQL